MKNEMTLQEIKKEYVKDTSNINTAIEYADMLIDEINYLLEKSLTNNRVQKLLKSLIDVKSNLPYEQSLLYDAYIAFINEENNNFKQFIRAYLKSQFEDSKTIDSVDIIWRFFYFTGAWDTPIKKKWMLLKI